MGTLAPVQVRIRLAALPCPPWLSEGYRRGGGARRRVEQPRQGQHAGHHAGHHAAWPCVTQSEYRAGSRFISAMAYIYKVPGHAISLNRLRTIPGDDHF
jgi:hypothetical protein